MKYIAIEQDDVDTVRMTLCGCETWYTAKEDAIQLAKDLLMACGASYLIGTEPGPQVGRGDRADAVVIADESEPETTVTTAMVLRFDEPIVETVLFRGRLIVRTQHSVWEIFDDADLGLRNKLLTPEEIAEVREPDVLTSATPTSSGMSLDEIQREAGIVEEVTPNRNEKILTGLIANLAARVKEQKPANQKNKELMDLLGDWEVYANELRKRIYACEAIIAIYEKLHPTWRSPWG